MGYVEYLREIFFDPSQRIYWPVLGASLLFAVLLISWHQSLKLGQGLWGSLMGGVSKVFSKSIWLHPSAILDYQLTVLNFSIKFLLRGFQSIAAVGLSLLVFTSLRLLPIDADGGVLKGMDLNPSILIAVYSIGLFVVGDFSRFLLHDLQHRIPFLWRFHRLHHSAEVLTPFTLYRFHPFETLCFSLRHILVTGIYAGIFRLLVSEELTHWTILGVDALGFLGNAVLANLRHSHVWISFGPIEYLLLSPAQHQIHHSSDPKHFNKNLGTFLPFWDLIWGSFYKSTGANGFETPLVFGLGVESSPPNLLNALSTQYNPPVQSPVCVKPLC